MLRIAAAGEEFPGLLIEAEDYEREAAKWRKLSEQSRTMECPSR